METYAFNSGLSAENGKSTVRSVRAKPLGSQKRIEVRALKVTAT